MKLYGNKSLSILLFFILTLMSSSALAEDASWVKVDEGLFIGKFSSPQKSVNGDSKKIIVIKIDPGLYKLKLLSASELNHPSLTAKKWAQKYKLIAVINAGMYLTDHRTNVGYMKNFDYLNNPRINSKYHSVAVFNPVDSSNAGFKIYDIDEVKMEEILRDYNTVIQNLRLIKRPGQNRWSQKEKKWSEAALGQDRDGNILFIFSRAPFSMHDLNNILLNLPINLVCAQHLEGGPEASLFFSYKNIKLELVGSYETDFIENENNNLFWPVPNVLGVVKE